MRELRCEVVRHRVLPGHTRTLSTSRTSREIAWELLIVHIRVLDIMHNGNLLDSTKECCRKQDIVERKQEEVGDNNSAGV